MGLCLLHHPLVGSLRKVECLCTPEELIPAGGANHSLLPGQIQIEANVHQRLGARLPGEWIKDECHFIVRYQMTALVSLVYHADALHAVNVQLGSAQSPH